MEANSRGSQSRAQIVRGDRLIDAVPEVLVEVAESAMLLSQGARRAIEMKREAGDQSAHPDVPATSAANQA